MKTISINISEKQIQALREQKNKTGVPVSFQIREAIDHYIKKQKEA